MAESYIDAEKDYMLGMKYKDIAKKYGVTINTVKSWKQRYAWSREKKGVHTNAEKVCTQKKKDASMPTIPIDDGTRETMHNEELTPKRQMFCIYYSRTFNGAQSYQKAYGCSYETAMTESSKLLRIPKVKAEIDRLKELKREQIVAGEEDIVELQMRIAFADIGGLMEFDQRGLRLEDSTQIDTQLIKKVKEGKEGISIELENRQKAIDWLSKHFLLHPEDKYKAEYERMRAKIDDNAGQKILQNMQTISEILMHPTPNRTVDDFEGGVKDEHTGTV